MGELVRANLKHHGRRYIATLVAVAIAVAFVAAALLFGGALNSAIRDQVAGQYKGAAAVVTLDYDQGEETDLAAAEDVIAEIPTVAQTLGIQNLSLQSATGAPNARYLTTTLVGGPILRPVTLVDGALPSSPSQVVVTEAAAERMDLTVGSPLSLKSWDDEVVRFEVSGIARTSSQSIVIGSEDVFVTKEAMQHLAPGFPPSAVLVGLDTENPSPAAQEDLVNAITNALRAAGLTGLHVETSDQTVNEALEGINTSDAAMTMMLLLFPVISATVALIVVGTTFQVIFRQRLRELALLRVIGATGSQVRNLMLTESLAVGFIGSLIGVAIGVLGGAGLGAAFSLVPSFAAGLTSITLGQVIILLVVGTLLTAAAGYRPALRASRVSPVAALAGEVETVQRRTRRQVVGGSITGVLAAVFAVWAAYLAFSETDDQAAPSRFALVLLLAVITAGLLIAFLSFVLPLITRASGRLGRSETYRLAAANTARNPGRTAATAIAVFIGVTLISMVTFGAESLRATSTAALDRTAPVDLIVSPAQGSFTDQELRDLETVTGVSDRAVVEGVSAVTKDDPAAPSEEGSPGELLVETGMNDVVRGGLPTASEGEVLVPAWWGEGPAPVTICVESTCQDLTAIPTQGIVSASGTAFVVSARTAQSFGVEFQPQEVWLKLDNPAEYQDVIEQIAAFGPELTIDGAIGLRATINQIVNVLLMVVVALLAVSVLVALVGITNTLSLSVAERTRENGLLRALGMSKRQVRSMLTWEALLIAVASTLLGIAAGGYFGAIGFAALPLGVGSLVFRVPWWQWLAIVIVAVLAALLASVIPGRSASRVSPVVALASE